MGWLGRWRFQVLALALPGASRRFQELPGASSLQGVMFMVNYYGLWLRQGYGGQGYGGLEEWAQAALAAVDTSLGFRGSCRVLAC